MDMPSISIFIVILVISVSPIFCPGSHDRDLFFGVTEDLVSEHR